MIRGKIKLKNDFTKRIDKIITALDIDEYQRSVIYGKWVYHVNYMNKQAYRNSRFYYFFQVLIISCGALIPVLTNVDEYDGFPCLVTGLGLIITISAAINQLYKFEKKWHHYRIIAEKLRVEGFAYLGLSEGYSKSSNHRNAFFKFSKNIDQILELDLTQYQEHVFSKADAK